MSRRPAPLLLLAATVALAACPRKPLRFGPEGEITDPDALLTQLDRRASKVLSLKGEAKVRVKTPEQSGTVGEFVAALRPAALHLETLNFFGKPVAVLASDGTRFALFVEEEGAFYTGPATPANVSRLLPIVLDSAEAVMILLGDIPRIPAQSKRLEIDPGARAYVLTLQSGSVTQRIWVSTEELRPLRSEVRGAPAYDLKLGDYQAYGDIDFPKDVELVTVDARGEPNGTEVQVKYKDLELNPPADLTLFALEQPANSKLIELDGEGRQVAPAPGAGPDVSGAIPAP